MYIGCQNICKSGEKDGYDWQKGINILAGKQLQLGEVQPAFAAFMTSLSAYARFMKLDYYTKKYMHRKSN